MQGRVHLYEGYTAKEVVFPIRVFARMGVKAVILTNAAGGIKREFTQGKLVVIGDHVNLQGVNPLTGPNDERFGLRFHDMTNAYDRTFREIVASGANNLGITMYEGVYAALVAIVNRLKGSRVTLTRTANPAFFIKSQGKTTQCGPPPISKTEVTPGGCKKVEWA